MGGSASQYSGTFTGTIDNFRAWSYNNGTLDGQNSNRDYFINNLLITHPVAGTQSNSTATVYVIREAGGENPAPEIANIDPNFGNGGLQFSLATSISGVTYVVWASPTLFPSQNWQKIESSATNANGGAIDLTLTNGLLPTNFYRIGYTL